MIRTGFNYKRGILCTLLIALISSPSYAINFNFLEHTVFSKFNAKEALDLKAFVVNTLGNADDLARVSWESESGIQAVARPVFTFEFGGKYCRKFQIALRGRPSSRKEVYTLDLCEHDKGWKIVDTPVTSLTKNEIDDLRKELFYVLFNIPEGQSSIWSSLESSKFAVIVALTSEGACRDASITLKEASGRSTQGTFEFCQDSNEGWARR